MHEHNPQISVWPLVMAFAITLIVIGIMATWIIALVGIAALIVAVFGWAGENRSADLAAHPVEIEHEERRHE
jgi:multisubunit Na+/H+ antiporter MnhC subunit